LKIKGVTGWDRIGKRYGERKLPYFKDLSMRYITSRDIIKWQNIMRESHKAPVLNNPG